MSALRRDTSMQSPRNFICPMTEDSCTDGRCKPGKCKPQEEIDAKQSGVARAAGTSQTNRGVNMAAYTPEQVADIRAFLKTAPTQQARILYLYDRGWSTA